MKIMDGQIAPDSGTVTIGQTVRIGYFSQENEAMDSSLRVIDYVREGGEYIETIDGTISASALLERFLFPSRMHYTTISRLSGGEKRRLYLLRILMESPNILFLDEPTNDLDIATLTILEDYLDQFDGIVVAVSHDRYFLDRVVRRIFAYEEDGHLVQYEGGYTDYQNALAAKQTDSAASLPASAASRNTQDTEPDTARQNRHNWKDGQVRKKKMTYDEQRDYASIEGDIEALEEQIENREAEILKASHDFVRLSELTVEKEKLELELEQKLERWEYLENLAESLGMTSL